MPRNSGLNLPFEGDKLEKAYEVFRLNMTGVQVMNVSQKGK